jgi:hypothetical protein
MEISKNGEPAGLATASIEQNLKKTVSLNSRQAY